MRNPLAGKKAKILYRNPDKSTVLQVEDEHDEILVTVEEDGTMYEERWSGVAGVREAWEAAAPSPGPVLVPNDAGQKVWTHLEPEPAPEPEPESELQIPPVADDVTRAARTLAIQIWGAGLMHRAELAPANDQCLAHAVRENWLVVDAGGRIVRGEVDPRPVTVTRIPNF